MDRRKEPGGKVPAEHALPAYFTVEAALIMPMVLGLFLLLISAAFCMEGRCLAAQVSYRAAYRAADACPGETSGSAEFGRLAGDFYFPGGRPGAEEERGQAVTLQGRVAMGPSFSRYGLPALSLSYEGRAKVLDPPLTIRRLKRTADRLKGVRHG